MVDTKIEASEMKKVTIHYLDKRKEILKNTQFKVEDIFCNIIGKVSFSSDQITIHNKLLAKLL